MEDKKVYLVKTAFEHDGFTYAEGEKYEFAPSVVATFAEGTVEEFVVEPPAPSTETGASTNAPAEEKTEAVPAKPWAGGHTVGTE